MARNLSDAGATSEAGPPPPRSIKDVIARDIVSGLYDGRYEPGQRLQEDQLTTAYGTSRGPVREALNALSALGVVELAPQRGAQVRVLRTAEAIDTLIVTQALIGLAARLAAGRAHDASARERLAASLDAIKASDPDKNGSAFALARDAFYGAISAMAHNTELRRLLPTVRVQLIRVQFRSVLRANDARSLQDYRRIADAILAQKANEAEAATRAHLARAIDRLRDFEAG